jgi:MarR family transcriptional regulator, organic hydroperoxide resistance regulator
VDAHHEQLDVEILDGVGELIGRIIGLGENIAQRLCVPSFFIKALHTLERPMAMKDLGKRMHCDPSFVTVVADMLEKRGLARREAHPGDRRVKNLVLTSDGLELKRRIETELAARMPWSRMLTEDERQQLLTLIRKMLKAEKPPEEETGAPAAADSPASQVTFPASPATPASPVTADTAPPAPAGEVDDILSAAHAG